MISDWKLTLRRLLQRRVICADLVASLQRPSTARCPSDADCELRLGSIDGSEGLLALETQFTSAASILVIHGKHPPGASSGAEG